MSTDDLTKVKHLTLDEQCAFERAIDASIIARYRGDLEDLGNNDAHVEGFVNQYLPLDTDHIRNLLTELWGESITAEALEDAFLRLRPRKVPTGGRMATSRARTEHTRCLPPGRRSPSCPICAALASSRSIPRRTTRACAPIAVRPGPGTVGISAAISVAWRDDSGIRAQLFPAAPSRQPEL